MGKKYIIELEDENYHQYSDSEPSDYLWRVKGFNALVFDEVGISKLTPYTEPDLEQVREEAYEEGRNSLLIEVQKAGKNTIKLEDDEYYQRGLSDAWGAARKIIRMPEVDLLNLFTECYSAVCTSLQVFLKYDASECIEKIRQYEQEKQEKDAEIKVGDEVINRDKKAVVTEITDRFVRIMYSDGGGYALFSEDMTKTGRHFPEIAAVLEKMRGEQEQEEIKVGDEVELKCGVRPAIYMQGTKGSDEIYLLFNDGSCGLHSKSEIVRKTGRHFPEIAAVFEKMRGEQDGET